MYLHENHPSIAGEVVCTVKDPHQNDERLPAFLKYVEKRLSED